MTWVTDLMRGDPATEPPRIALLLGYAGLSPQLIALGAVALGGPDIRFTALAMAYAYAALILSFLGGLWWGNAATVGQPVPSWIWVAAVTPSLIALASAIPWAIGAEWPGPSMILLAIGLIGSLGIDVALARMCLCPIWWLSLRIPLSIGLGLSTLAIALLGVR